jgi:hypothetical protein
MCTLYPVSWEGAVVQPTQFSPGWSAKVFQGALASELSKAGIDPRMPVAGRQDLALVISLHVLRADPGSQAKRWMFTLIAGYAVFEVVGQVGSVGVPFVQFGAKGVRRWGLFGGDSQTLLSDAAKMAGGRAAAQILAILAAR